MRFRCSDLCLPTKTFEHYKKMAPSETHLRTVMSNGVGMVDALKLLNPELMATDEARTGVVTNLQTIF